MPDKEKGLTGISEVARGFVGSKIRFDYTGKNGRARLRVDIACGAPDIARGKFATWRHCIIYGDIAEALKNIKQGELLRVRGWVVTEALLDEYGKPITEDGKIVMREYLICWDAEKKAYQKLQPELELIPESVPV